MGNRLVRMGIDVGGTHTKAVAIDNATHEIMERSSVKTTHDDRYGVAAGMVKAFRNCLRENDIAPEGVIFMAHSTTQATSALIEGDVVHMGMLGIGPGGMEDFLIKRQTRLKDTDLRSGRNIKMKNRYLSGNEEDENTVREAIEELKTEGTQVLTASDAYGVDDITGEQFVFKVVHNEMGMETTVASDITKPYDLTRRARTAAIDTSTLPKMLSTANPMEEGVRKTGVGVPLTIVRGDGGAVEINEMKKRPVLTMLSGPATNVMGSPMRLRASDGVYFEVGGTTTDIDVIENGRPTIDYSVVGGHGACISSLDVRVLGVAGGGMIRVSKSDIHDVGPRPAHIAGLDYAILTDEGEIVELQPKFFSPKEGDPEGYVAIRLKSGKYITITNSCAANVLGLVTPRDFPYGNVDSARKAMQPTTDYLDTTVKDMASQILTKAYGKVEPIIMELASKYRPEHDQISLVDVGGDATSLIGFYVDKMNIKYSVPENAEVTSSISVTLAIVRDVIERVVPNPTPDDIRSVKREAVDKAVESEAVPKSVEVRIEIDSQTSKLAAIALGSTEVRTTDLLKECSEEEARDLAVEDLRSGPEELNLVDQAPNFYVYNMGGRGREPLRILGKKGFVKVQGTGGEVILAKASSYRSIVSRMWEEMATFKADAILRPDYYLCVGARVTDFNGTGELKQALILMDVEMQMVDPSGDIVIVGAENQL